MKYKISGFVEVKLKTNAKTTTLSTDNEQRLLKVERECGYFKSQGKECDMTIDNRIGFERVDQGEMVKVQNGNRLHRERIQNLQLK